MKSDQIIEQFREQLKEMKEFLQRGDREDILAQLSKDGHDYSIESVHKCVNGRGKNIVIAQYVLLKMKERKKEFESFVKASSKIVGELKDLDKKKLEITLS